MIDGAWSHMDNYGLVEIRLPDDSTTEILESTFNEFWKSVGVNQGTKQFIRRIYFSKMLNPLRTNCKHMECDLIETFGYESNIIRCRKCKIYFRESSNHYGVCYSYHDNPEIGEHVIYRGKFDRSKKNEP